MARPRSRSDEEVFEGLARAITRRGPDKLSLADVAAEVGLTAPALVQRFGSRRGLLLAYSKSFYAGLEPAFEDAVEAYDGPVAAAIGLLCDLSAPVKSPKELANHVAFLYVDLTDPDFYAPFLAWSEALVARLETLLEDAVRQDILATDDPRRLARALWTTYNGALLTWAIHRQGRLRDWMRGSLELALDPYQRPGNSAQPPSSKTK